MISRKIELNFSGMRLLEHIRIPSLELEAHMLKWLRLQFLMFGNCLYYFRLSNDWDKPDQNQKSEVQHKSFLCFLSNMPCIIRAILYHLMMQQFIPWVLWMVFLKLISWGKTDSLIISPWLISMRLQHAGNFLHKIFWISRQ
jgi:hypothetical protein